MTLREREPLSRAAHGRAWVVPRAGGARWAQGAVSDAERTGVLLAEGPRRAGPKDSAGGIILAGANRAGIKEPPAPAGAVRHGRGMPPSQAADDVLRAIEMTGEEPATAHGWPLRRPTRWVRNEPPAPAGWPARNPGSP